MCDEAKGEQRDWVQTASGRQVWLPDPDPESIDIVDIATALSKTCRFNGHCSAYYSVAQHSVHVSRLCPTELQLAGLLHNAAEAYCGDLVRPLKNLLPQFESIERRIQAAIGQRFGIDINQFDSYAVKYADNVMLATELRDLMKPPPSPWVELPDPIAETIEPMTWQAAKAAFFERFEDSLEYLESLREDKPNGD